MSTEPAAPRPAAPRVVAVISADDADLLVPCLDAVGRQVYGPARVIVVGGNEEVRRVATAREAMWRPHLGAVYDAIDAEFDYVWALRQRARPDPGALAALVTDGVRVDASVAGSKVVDAGDPEVLVSVGYATDVFDAPYSGLQAGELDQSQYDVIRDVAAVADTSMLIRRDLFRGLGGVDPIMPPTSAAVDFCQRARLRGGRIVVIPSSVVRYQGSDPAPRWRERAGETRAMIKAYSPLTLLWVLPIAFLVGLVESVIGIFVGRFALPGVLAAGFWNLFHLPSAIKARFQARRGRAVGDEELFRYQVSGATRVRALWDEVATRVRARFPEGVLSGFADAVEAGQQRIRNPGFFVGFVVIVFSLVAAREIWSERLPVVGFSLPPPESALAALRAYAGGWNPAGLGSPEVLAPSVAATALVQVLTLGRGGVAVALITVGALAGGAFGMSRLLRTWGVANTSGLLAGLVLMAGPAVAAVAGDTHWAALPAIAAVPWAVALALQARGGAVRSLAGATLFAGIGAMFFPATLPLTAVAATTWAAVGVGPRWPGVVRAWIATAGAAVMLIPWILFTDPIGYLTAGSAPYWSPGWIVLGAIVVAVVGIRATGDATLSALATFGGALAVTGTVAARSGGLGAGAPLGVMGLSAVALGVAVVAGAALEVGVRRRVWGGMAGVGARAAFVAAVVLVGATTIVAAPGRAGLPADAFSDSFRFAAATDTPGRILLFGPVDRLPGEARTLDGLGYRVIVPPYPSSWEADLNDPRLGDESLESLLRAIVDGEVRRAGAGLAEFGIAWVVFVEPSPLELVFESQLDLVPLRSLDFPVFRNEIASGVAMSPDGRLWAGDGTSFAAPDGAAGAVTVAVNADYRWGPGTWEQAGWANRIAGAGDTVGFSGHPGRRMQALAAGAWAAFLGAVCLVARPRRSRS